MELTTKGRYAVMAMADLAKAASFGTGVAVSLVDIADRQHLSVSYLEQLFAKLRAAGLVESVRGRNGGYRLATPADHISIASVLTAVDEPTRMTRCGGLDAVGCVGEKRCLTHGLWSALGTHIRSFLDAVTLGDVVDGDVARVLSPDRRADGSLVEEAAQ